MERDDAFVANVTRGAFSAASGGGTGSVCGLNATLLKEYVRFVPGTYYYSCLHN